MGIKSQEKKLEHKIKCHQQNWF